MNEFELADLAIANRFRVTPDRRMSEKDALRLLAIPERTMRAYHDEGAGWRRYRIALSGCSYSVYLRDVAEWLDSRTEEPA